MAYIETSIKCNLDKKHFLPSDYRDPGNVARSKPSPINSNAWTPCPTVLGRGSSSGKNKKERKKGRKQIVVWFIPSITMELPTRSKLLPTSISARVYFRSEFDQPWRFKSWCARVIDHVVLPIALKRVYSPLHIYEIRNTRSIDPDSREGCATRFITVLLTGRFPSVSNRRATSNLSLRIPRIFVFLTARGIINFCPWTYQVCDVNYYCYYRYTKIGMMAFQECLIFLISRQIIKCERLRWDWIRRWFFVFFFVYTFFIQLFYKRNKGGIIGFLLVNSRVWKDVLILWISIIHFPEKWYCIHFSSTVWICSKIIFILVLS